MVAKSGVVKGRVQGVGFRFFAVRAAAMTEVSGWVRNNDDDSVEYFVQGEERAVAAFLNRLREGPSHAQVSGVTVREENIDSSISNFEIRY